jgi:hypothetical protein
VLNRKILASRCTGQAGGVATSSAPRHASTNGKQHKTHECNDLRLEYKGASPALLGGLARDPESVGNLGPGVVALAQTVDGGRGGFLLLAAERDELDQALDVAGGDPAGVAAMIRRQNAAYWSSLRGVEFAGLLSRIG